MRRFRKSFRYGERGFTLIELLIVVAILGILAAVVIPNVGTFMTSGKVGAANAEVRSVELSVDAMSADAGTTVCTVAAAWDGTSTGTPTATDGIKTYSASDYLDLKGAALTGKYDVTVSGNVSGTTGSYPPLVWNATSRRWEAP